MQLQDFIFERPSGLQASQPPEARGLSRDQVRLLVTTPHGHRHARFVDLPDFLDEGDLLVVNRSATLAASLPAMGAFGSFILNLSTAYGQGIWLAEPRWSAALPGPLPVTRGAEITVADLTATLIAPHPGIDRLWFVRVEGDLCRAMALHGSPIRYGYLAEPQPLAAYQTLFSAVPGSAEMPSAARPFTRRVVEKLRSKGISFAGLLLHTGVSSLEIETKRIEDHTLYAEPFQVPLHTANAVNKARAEGRRVIAVGTTVIRALESAWDGGQVQPRRGFTRTYVHPARGNHVADGLLTGFHDPKASHLAMLYAVAGSALIRSGYAEAVDHGYLWHEFGDSHLILSGEGSNE
jgi:S-adenosylmethionine:tRNA ribosyltransferase-isomerase